MCFKCRAFPFPCCPQVGTEDLRGIRAAISSDNIQVLRCYFVTYRKKLEEVVFVDEEFLHKNTTNKDVYVDYSAMADIQEDAVKKYGDLTTLN